MNRLHLLIALALLISSSGYSQLNKKIWLIGGAGSYKSYKELDNLSPPSESSTFNVNYIVVSVKAGYFVADKLILGLIPTYSYTNIKRDNNTLFDKISTYSIGPFARYYFLNKNKPFNVLAEINSQLGFQSNDDVSKEKISTKSFSVLAGPEIFFNPTIGIEILLGYQVLKEIKTNSDNPYTMNQKGFQVSIGFQIHLKK